MDKYFLDQVMGENGKQSNHNAIYHCCECHHRKQKLSFDLNTQMFQCWVCGFKGKGLYKIFKKLNTPQLLVDRYYKEYPIGKKPLDLSDEDDFGTIMYRKLYGNDEFI